MFKIFLQSILLFSDDSFDILLVCSPKAHKALRNLAEIRQNSSRFLFHETKESANLFDALISKCDISDVRNLGNYEKVLYLDCDIIVQHDLGSFFKKAKLKPDRLYAPAEGTVDGKYWYLDTYKESNIKRLKDAGVRSFNTGTFMFVPSSSMLKHFVNVRALALSYKGQKHFYDQSFMNYYFNMKRMVDTGYLTKHVVMFPDHTKYYPNKTFLHFAGLGRYKEKSRLMKGYLNNLKKLNHGSAGIH
jgi:hypothetical protein